MKLGGVKGAVRGPPAPHVHGQQLRAVNRRTSFREENGKPPAEHSVRCKFMIQPLRKEETGRWGRWGGKGPDPQSSYSTIGTQDILKK